MPFDCELITDGLLAQPVNAISSLAFLVSASALVRSGLRIHAALMAAVAVGSVLFHGFPSSMSSVAHDLAVLALVIAVAAIVLRRPSVVLWLPTALLLGGLVVWFFSRTGGPLCDPTSTVQGHAIWHLLAATGVTLIFQQETA